MRRRGLEHTIFSAANKVTSVEFVSEATCDALEFRGRIFTAVNADTTLSATKWNFDYDSENAGNEGLNLLDLVVKYRTMTQDRKESFMTVRKMNERTQCAFEGHQSGKSFDFIKVDASSVSNASFSGKHVCRMLRTVARDDLYGTIIAFNRKFKLNTRIARFHDGH